MTLNVTAELERLVTDAVRLVPEFSHIRPEQILLCVTSSRGGGIHGTYAKIHPLRFEGGGTTKITRRGRRNYEVAIPAVTHGGRDILYLIYFLVPRFLDLPLREKLITIFHELYHVSPSFDGDIRRFPGPKYAHGSSRKKYNETVGRVVDAYLAAPDRQALPDFLQSTASDLHGRHTAIVARKMKPPRLSVRPLPKG